MKCSTSCAQEKKNMMPKNPICSSREEKFDSSVKFSKPKNLLRRRRGRVTLPYSFASILIKDISFSLQKEPLVFYRRRLKSSFTSMKRCFCSSPSFSSLSLSRYVPPTDLFITHTSVKQMLGMQAFKTSSKVR